MKTVMQELIEIIKSKRKQSDISNTLLRFAQVEAEKLLEKEQIQLAKAFDLGVETLHQRGGVVSRAFSDWDEVKEQI